ncbi:hypothetical protein M408DRAFT_23549 [Serendipita vermifera MAFF 305830]|uniref:Uncharacterized protein n=1 Tax=Serendipita vermifera MAFF 305830 TaxID=933852 RepID=A0A0C2XHB7_SERVB|nr:hypothetical protein M408DRAFT_23549 [Serendipita vermifera MAFF 305830]
MATKRIVFLLQPGVGTLTSSTTKLTAMAATAAARPRTLNSRVNTVSSHLSQRYLASSSKGPTDQVPLDANPQATSEEASPPPSPSQTGSKEGGKKGDKPGTSNSATARTKEKQKTEADRMIEQKWEKQ